MSGLFLTRARLRSDLGVRALAPLLRPEAEGAAALAGHHLIWSLCADGAERRRDFLWRETTDGAFLILSARPPGNPHGLFEIDPAKPFDPGLRTGRRLRFDLRANATVSDSRGAVRRGRRTGLLAQRLRAVKSEERPVEAQNAAFSWLSAQGARHGFALDRERFLLRRESDLRVPRKGTVASFEVMDLEGELEVKEPEAMLAAIRQGIGRARAFGCGLMLLARAAG
jgi:CRISPR system Cascade subunit CasE